MKRYIKSATTSSRTFYVTDLNHPWNSLATLPNFSIEEAVDCIKNDPSFNEDCIPMTSAERKRFLKKCDEVDEGQYKDVYEEMKDTFIYQQFLAGNMESTTTSYSFWVTSAYDSRTTVFAVGADIVGDYQFNLSRIAKRLGETKFYNYVAGKGKRVKTFSTLVDLLNKNGVKDANLTEGDLIKACNEGRYFYFYS